MPQTFTCPKCGAPLEIPPAGTTSVVCSFCSTPVIVPQEIRGKPSQAKSTMLTGPSEVLSVAWSPDGQRLASGSADNTIWLWDVASSTKLATLTGHTKPVSSVAWSPDGRQLASGSYDNTIMLWDAASLTKRITLAEPKRGFLGNLRHTAEISSVAWSPDSKRLASGSSDGTITQWDAAGGTKLTILSGNAKSVHMAWSPDGRQLASGSGEGNLMRFGM